MINSRMLGHFTNIISIQPLPTTFPILPLHPSSEYNALPNEEAIGPTPRLTPTLPQIKDAKSRC
ncbi:hypothetical protein BDY19DRAFT_950013 [Irpex rosettiformis]|uniref:Uncharacterized protein n=1 Tax=Irpex rosettiformis TaxID=378272 RepID=A0ACB8U1W0_9APHY|nr:hypothetical protein BDY19DRAFT_950013 [Irpex rosettiformis]